MWFDYRQQQETDYFFKVSRPTMRPTLRVK